MRSFQRSIGVVKRCSIAIIMFIAVLIDAQTDSLIVADSIAVVKLQHLEKKFVSYDNLLSIYFTVIKKNNSELIEQKNTDQIKIISGIGQELKQIIDSANLIPYPRYPLSESWINAITTYIKQTTTLYNNCCIQLQYNSAAIAQKKQQQQLFNNLLSTLTVIFPEYKPIINYFQNNK